ncbi:transcriptional regulator, XRE family with cupin sensor [Bradyrhizobium sp. Rc3b]|uniref:helix-turn-helix domain-containing protein n=1 Tax=Bradyrhizobium sp. Rc3b TaxID=1855322 RepID=UPI0008E2C0E8|nr:XRE family transcriptional regulator [Bradyrhizobium sp. Rc3b]SFN92515.1 transcriptional regulator, XRE family with cupin sensor [Bradyrhizobium sp. Rc3b]
MAIRSIRAADEWASSEAKGDLNLEAAVGGQIRELRKIKKLTLAQLAQAADISVGYLSQLERNQSKLPIGVLKKLSDVLGVHMNWFFNGNMQATADERDVVVRKAYRRRLTFTGLGIAEELLSPNLAGPLELLMSTIEPGADSGEYSHDGNEAGVLIAGQLDLWVDGKLFQLEEGDSFSFSSTSQHRCANPGTVPAKVVWVITPPHY